MTAPRFFFITNDLPRAALEFSCHPGNLPQWMAVLDNIDDWMKIPAGSKCHGLWFGSAADVEGWRNAWAARKERRDLTGISNDELDTIMAWCETHRAAPSRALLFGENGAASTSPLVGEDRQAGRACEPLAGLGEGCEPAMNPSPTAAMASASPLPAFVSSPTRGEVVRTVGARRASKWI